MADFPKKPEYPKGTDPIVIAICDMLQQFFEQLLQHQQKYFDKQQQHQQRITAFQKKLDAMSQQAVVTQEEVADYRRQFNELTMQYQLLPQPHELLTEQQQESIAKLFAKAKVDPSLLSILNKSYLGK